MITTFPWTLYNNAVYYDKTCNLIHNEVLWSENYSEDILFRFTNVHKVHII